MLGFTDSVGVAHHKNLLSPYFSHSNGKAVDNPSRTSWSPIAMAMIIPVAEWTANKVND